MFLNSPSLLQYKIANGYFKMPLNSNLSQGFLTLNYVDCTVYMYVHISYGPAMTYSSELPVVVLLREITCQTKVAHFEEKAFRYQDVAGC